VQRCCCWGRWHCWGIPPGPGDFWGTGAQGGGARAAVSEAVVDKMLDRLIDAAVAVHARRSARFSSPPHPSLLTHSIALSPLPPLLAPSLGLSLLAGSERVREGGMVGWRRSSELALPSNLSNSEVPYTLALRPWAHADPCQTPIRPLSAPLPPLSHHLACRHWPAGRALPRALLSAHRGLASSRGRETAVPHVLSRV
jgi:hypothetical protein